MTSEGQLVHRLGNLYVRERRQALTEQADVTRRVQQSTTGQGNIREEALPETFTFDATLYLPGAVTVGVDQSALLPVMGQRGRLRTLIARAKMAPGGGECTVVLTANGVDVAAVTLQPGEVKRATPIGPATTVDAGADLQCRVTAANGAADITLTCIFAPVGS